MLDHVQSGRVLDPVERASEAIFGVLMAVSITGSLSVATAGHEEIREMLAAAVGCNLAWGLTDAVMYLIAAAVERGRRRTLYRRLQGDDPAEGRRLIAAELDESVASVLGEPALEALRGSLLVRTPPSGTLSGRDFVAAFAVFALVVLVTFPLVIPFLLFGSAATALRVSNGVALAILFGYGHVLGRHTGGSPWRYGVVIAGVGVALVAAVMALGG